MAISRPLKPEISSQLTLWSPAHLANPFPSPEAEAAWRMSVVTWRSNILSWLVACGPDGWLGRTSPGSSRQTEAGTLAPSSGSWGNSGMGSHGECLTLNISEFHSAAVASSLSDILEIGDLPSRYSLSVTACRGILRRAAKRGKALPANLQTALEDGAHKPPPN